MGRYQDAGTETSVTRLDNGDDTVTHDDACDDGNGRYSDRNKNGFPSSESESQWTLAAKLAVAGLNSLLPVRPNVIRECISTTPLLYFSSSPFSSKKAQIGLIIFSFFFFILLSSIIFFKLKI